MFKRFIVIAASAALAAPVTASTPAAWNALQALAERSCIQKSGLRQPRTSSSIVFPDQIGTVALLVTGKAPLASRSNQSITQLCLYDRRRKTTFLEEAKGWAERPQSH